MLMLFLEQDRGRPTWSLRATRGRHVGDPCSVASALYLQRIIHDYEAIDITAFAMNETA